MRPLLFHRKFLTVLTLLTLLSLFALSAGSIQISHAQELRIAYCSDQAPYLYTNDKGEADGLIIDTWRLWSQKNNIPIHFIATSSDKALSLLQSGEVDVHAGMTIDISTVQNLQHGPVLHASNAIIFTDKDIKYSGSLDELNAYRVGVIQEENTAAYLENHLQQGTVKFFPNYQQLMDAVADGRIKVFAADALTSFFHLNTRGILNSFYYNRSESLFISEWRATTLATNKEVLNIINSGMDLISMAEKSNIIRRWSNGIPNTITDAVIIATPIKYPPLSVIGNDGTARGYLIDLWREWGRQVNKEIQFRGSVWNETLRGIQSGEADIHSGLFKNEERENWLDFSSPFFTIETAVFYKIDKGKVPPLDNLGESPVGAIQGSYQETFLKKEHPSIKVIGYADLDRLFIALFRGDIEAIVAEQQEVTGTLTRLGLSGTVQKGETLFQNHLYAGVRKGNKELLALVEKGLNAIPDPKKQQIQEHYFAPESTLPAIVFWSVLFIIVLLFSMLFFSVNNKILNRRIGERTIELRKSEQRLQKILARAPLGILIADVRSLQFQYANPAICAMLGYEKEELEKMDMRSVHDAADFNDVIRNFRKQAKGMQLIAQDTPFLRKDGEKFKADVITAPIEFGKLSCLAGFIVDLTERKQLETQLNRAKKMEAIGLMAGGVAHDLNNILAGIISYPELMLLQLPQSSDMRKPLEAIQESGRRAADVVADLLTVARGVASKKESYDINLLVENCLDSPEYRTLKNSHPEILCVHQLETQDSTISCSPTHIKKAIMNLLINAVEAVGLRGKIHISTTNRQINKSEKLSRVMAPGNYVLLTVQDNGPGIADKDLEHIFEPFYTKKKLGQSGTGLGLAIVWNTVQDHNGGIFVESSEVGTCFHLYFPVSQEKGTFHAREKKKHVPAGTGEHILIVDDEPQLRDIATQILTMSGYKVDSVSSGELALNFLKDRQVDLIILDMLMEPGMNGRQTYEEILKLYPSQKAIIASGFSESDDVTAALQLGADGFIKKPYSMDLLGRSVKKALAG
jgi:PAS domain S-box-containing protein